jgi:hypothetical protein
MTIVITNMGQNCVDLSEAKSLEVETKLHLISSIVEVQICAKEVKVVSYLAKCLHHLIHS